MDFPLILTAIVAIIVTIYFAAKGLVSFGGSMDDKAFFLLGGTVVGRHAAASHAAATMSLATTFMFFLSYGKAFGLSLLVAPVTLIAGAYLFGTLILSRLDAQGFFGNDRPSTLAEYVQRRTGSRLLSKSVLFATCLTMLSIVLIELFLSVEIFSIFFRESHAGLFRPQDAALILIMLTAFAYTAFGGLKAVVSSCCMGRVLALAWAGLAALWGWSVGGRGRFCAVCKQFS